MGVNRPRKHISPVRFLLFVSVYLFFGGLWIVCVGGGGGRGEVSCIPN